MATQTILKTMVLKNARYELFAQAVASGKTPTEAYTLAGFKPDAGNAHRMTNRDEVRQRIAELQSAMMARTVKAVNHNREWVINELIDNATKAKADKDYSASNAALRLIGSELSMFISRSESGKPGDFDNISTADDVVKAARKELGDDIANMLLQLVKPASSDTPSEPTTEQASQPAIDQQTDRQTENGLETGQALGQATETANVVIEPSHEAPGSVN